MAYQNLPGNGRRHVRQRAQVTACSDHVRSSPNKLSHIHGHGKCSLLACLPVTFSLCLDGAWYADDVLGRRLPLYLLLRHGVAARLGSV